MYAMAGDSIDRFFYSAKDHDIKEIYGCLLQDHLFLVLVVSLIVTTKPLYVRQMVRLYQLMQSGNCETRLKVIAMAGSLWSLAM
jgi:hypothetical protein